MSLTILGVAGAIVVLGGAGAVIRAALPRIRAFGRFMDEITGEPEQFGRPERPGLIQRLDSLQDDVGSIKHEVFSNSGSSLRDAVDRLEDRIKRIESQAGSQVTVNLNKNKESE